MRRALVTAVVLIVCWAPLVARAEPLDVANLAERSILIEVPGAALQIPGSYGPKLVGGIPSLTEGEVEIAAADYESYLAEVGDSPGGVPVPGSFSDVILVVDVPSLSVTADPVTGQVDLMVGPLADLVRTLGTARTAGFQTVQIFPGTFITIYCDGPTVFGPCQIVPGSPFDTATGEFTMVGDDTLTHPDITDPRFGKYFASNSFRLIEVPLAVPGLGSWGIAALAAALLTGLALVATRPAELSVHNGGQACRNGTPSVL